MGITQIIRRRFLAALIILGGYVECIDLGLQWAIRVAFACGRCQSACFCGTTGLGFIYDFVLAQVEKLQLRATFERYTSPNVAKYLLDNSATYQEMLAGTRKPVTIPLLQTYAVLPR